MTEVEYLADHHSDCDGWRVAHPTTMTQVSRKGRGMWQATCADCDWRSSLVGPDARSLVARERAGHGDIWTQCVGECSTWELT